MSDSNQSNQVNVKPRHWSWWFKQLFSLAMFFICTVAFIAFLGMAQRAGLLQKIGTGSNDGAAGAGENVIYTCPMDPQIRQPMPGRCPICGMALEVASKQKTSAEDILSTQIEPAQRRLANIQTQPVVRTTVFENIETIGFIKVDESRQSTIAAYIDGRVEKMFADYTGVEVAKGDHLAEVYSPQ